MPVSPPPACPPGTRGLGLYVLPRQWEGQRNGFRIERLKDKLGERSFPTGEVTLDGARAFLLGGPGEGFHQMTQMLNLSRLYNAVASVAVMRRAVVEAWDFCDQRVAFGRKVTEHPLMTEVLLDLACEQRLALNWTFRAVGLMDVVDFGAPTEAERRTLRMLTPLLKYVLGKKAVAVVSEAVEALGGNGYIEDWPLARVLRDAQVLPIWEGTSNILVLDAFRVMRKERGHEVLFDEVQRGVAEAPAELQGRLGQLLEELKGALQGLSRGPETQYAWRDWTDRAALLWSVAVSLSTSLGHGTPSDVRAARRVLERQVPRGLLRTDRASVEEVRAVAFG
jgi:acyl-CoA dehydrogenase